MPGWFITGVRGEGKGIAALNMIRKYALAGRPVATNMDLYVDKLVPSTSDAVFYRLPDKPDLQDLQVLPPAYDVDYKDDDRNGLLVFDEAGTFMNTRSWTDKSRLPLLNWLFLSRKLHWDIIILAQDIDTVDAQMRNTLCDYWVQSSRSDRNSIPFIGSLLRSFGFSGKMARSFEYFVFYGFGATQHTEKWSISGVDLFDAYNTNQIFKDNAVYNPDIGAYEKNQFTYTLLPASYLSGHKYLTDIKNKFSFDTKTIETIYKEGDKMAVKKTIDTNNIKMKLILAAVVIFLGWRYFNGNMSLPTAKASVAPATVAPATVAPATVVPATVASAVAIQTNNFIDNLLQFTQPRLAWVVMGHDGNYAAGINFEKDGEVVERYDIKELHALGVAFIKKPYGFDMLYKGNIYMLSWGGRVDKQQSAKVDKKDTQTKTASIKPMCQIKSVMSDEEIKACSS